MMKGGGGKKRSENEKERTKMRERMRRAITINIFKGLRKHGGYRLSHRSDISAVLRQLANEAGFVVKPDGITYRSQALIKCPECGAASANFSIPYTTITTNGSSFVMGGVESSSMVPFSLPKAINNIGSIGDLAGTLIMAPVTNGEPGTNNNDIVGCSSPLLGFDGPISVPVYTSQNEVNVDGGGGFAECCAAMAMGSNVRGSDMTYEEMQREALHLEEVASMSNSNYIHSYMMGPMPMSLPHF